MTPEEYAITFMAQLQGADSRTSRSQQTSMRRIGPSDLICRERVRRILTGIPKTDSVASTAALMGTFIHTGISEYRHGEGLLHDIEVEITLPSGLQLTGHADEVDTINNEVTDFKTATDLAYRKRAGAEDSHIRQVHLYALGLLQAGILKENPTVRLCYIDRSGREPEPWVWQIEYEPNVIAAADEWLTDVQYAIENKEEASRDWPVGMCRRFCPWYSSCRPEDNGGLPVNDPKIIEAANIYLEASEDEAEAKRVKEQARHMLKDADGVTPDGLVVRWTTINHSINGPYQRLEVRHQ